MTSSISESSETQRILREAAGEGRILCNEVESSDSETDEVETPSTLAIRLVRAAAKDPEGPPPPLGSLSTLSLRLMAAAAQGLEGQLQVTRRPSDSIESQLPIVESMAALNSHAWKEKQQTLAQVANDRMLRADTDLMQERSSPPCPPARAVFSVSMPPDALQEKDGTQYFGIDVNFGGYRMWGVHKRYDEFHKLSLLLSKSDLCKKKGWSQPPFPRKYITKCKGEALRARNVALELWLQEVVSRLNEEPQLYRSCIKGSRASLVGTKGARPVSEWSSAVFSFLDWGEHQSTANIMQSASAPPVSGPLERMALECPDLAETSKFVKDEAEARYKGDFRDFVKFVKDEADAAEAKEEEIEHKLEVHTIGKSEAVRVEAQLYKTDAGDNSGMDLEWQLQVEGYVTRVESEQETLYRAQEEEAARQLEDWLQQEAKSRAQQEQAASCKVEEDRLLIHQAIDMEVQTQIRRQMAEMAILVNNMDAEAAHAARILVLSREPNPVQVNVPEVAALAVNVPETAALTCKVTPRIAIASPGLSQ